MLMGDGSGCWAKVRSLRFFGESKIDQMALWNRWWITLYSKSEVNKIMEVESTRVLCGSDVGQFVGWK